MCPCRMFLGDMEGLQDLGKVIILVFIVQWLHVILYDEKNWQLQRSLEEGGTGYKIIDLYYVD